MAKIRKGVDRLPSGAYRYRLREGGVNYTFTDTILLSTRETRERFTKLIGETSKSAHKSMTFGDASQRHLKAVSAVLSPSTLYLYASKDKLLREAYRGFYDLPIDSITAEDIQEVISDYSQGRSRNTVKRTLSYITIVLRQHGIDMRRRIRSGGYTPSMPYIPTADEVKAVFDAVDGTPYSIPFKLAALGLRRSEICALRLDDLDGDHLSIRRSKVMTLDGVMVKDSTKTRASTRVILIPHQLAEQIRQEGRIYEGSLYYLTEMLRKVQKRLGLPFFSLHKLRHFYASQAHALGVPDSYVMRATGWASSSTLNIYRHALKDKTDDFDRVTVDFLDGLMTKS